MGFLKWLADALRKSVVFAPLAPYVEQAELAIESFVREFVDKVLKPIWDALNSAWSFLTQTVWPRLVELANAFKSFSEFVVNKFKELTTYIDKVRAELWGSFLEALSNFKQVVEATLSEFSSALSQLASSVANVWSWIQGLPKHFWNFVSGGVAWIWSSISSAVANLAKTISESVVAPIKDSFEKFKETVQRFTSEAQRKFAEIYEFLSSLPNIFNQITQIFSSIPELVYGFVVVGLFRLGLRIVAWYISWLIEELAEIRVVDPRTGKLDREPTNWITKILISPTPRWVRKPRVNMEMFNVKELDQYRTELQSLLSAVSELAIEKEEDKKELTKTIEECLDLAKPISREEYERCVKRFTDKAREKKINVEAVVTK